MCLDEHFYPVPYKTIISHFEHAIDMMKDELGLERLIEWPPDKQLIEAAGGVGFGSYHLHCKGGRASARNGMAVAELPEEDTLIPPVIRQIHGRLKVQGYRRYRNDPLFLHRNCNVCEHCFLSYAQLASTSFQMINPVRIDEVGRRDRLAAGGHRRQVDQEEVEDVDGDDWSEEDDSDDQSDFFSGHFDSARIHGGATATSKSIGMLLSGAPTLPPVILEPPKDDNGDYQETSINTTSPPSHAPLHPRAPPEAINLDDFLAKHMAPPAPPRHPYQPSNGENPRHPLEHLISSYEMMERTKTTQPVPVPRKQQHNPYKVSQRIVVPRGQATKTIPTKGQKHNRKKTAADDEIKNNESKVHDVEVHPAGSLQARELELPTEQATAKDETVAGSNDNGDSQTRPSVSKLTAEDKQLLTSALSEIYEKQREMTLSQSQLLIPESL